MALRGPGGREGGGGGHGRGRPGSVRVVWRRCVERRRGAAVSVLVALLPLVQLIHRATTTDSTSTTTAWPAQLRGEVEVAEAVLGVFVLTGAGSGGCSMRGAGARGLWKGLVAHLPRGGELGQGGGGAAGEGVLLGRGSGGRGERERDVQMCWKQLQMV